MRPVSGLPALTRAAGDSTPCASAFLSMCSRGALMRSSTLRSSSTSAPSISSSAFFSTSRAVCRTTR
jgi:hypothetical protein